VNKRAKELKGKKENKGVNETFFLESEEKNEEQENAGLRTEKDEGTVERQQTWAGNKGRGTIFTRHDSTERVLNQYLFV